MQKHSVSSNPLYFTRQELSVMNEESDHQLVTAQPYYITDPNSPNASPIRLQSHQDIDAVFDLEVDPHYAQIPADIRQQRSPKVSYDSQLRPRLPTYENLTNSRQNTIDRNRYNDVFVNDNYRSNSRPSASSSNQNTLGPPVPNKRFGGSPYPNATQNRFSVDSIRSTEIQLSAKDYNNTLERPPPVAPRLSSKQNTIDRRKVEVKTPTISYSEDNAIKFQSNKFGKMNNLADYNNSYGANPVSAEMTVDIDDDQIFAKNANRSQAQPTVEIPSNETEYREWLKEKFYHYFAAHERTGGIDITDMEHIMKTDPNWRHLRTGKANKLAENMDKNKDKKISWQEFFDSVTIKRKEDVSRFQRWIVSTIKAVSPAVEKHKKNNEEKYGKDVLDGETEEPLDSYLEAYNCRPPPIFVPICCIAQIVVFIVYAIELNAGPEWNRVTWTSGVPHYSPLVFDPAKREQVWRFISYMWLHAGYHHICFNLVIQLALGIPLELVHKAWRVAPVFILGVLGGSLCSSVFDHKTSLVGASGGCYALMGAHLALVIMNWEELQHDWLNCKKRPINFLCSGVVRLIFLCALLGLDFGVALYKRYGLGEKTQTSFLAHIGGLVAGLLVGIPVLKNLDKKPWENVVFYISIVLIVALFTAAVIYNAFYPSYAA